MSCRGGQKKLKKGSVVTYNHDISSFRSFLHSSVLKSSPLIHKEQMIVQQIRRLSPYYCCLVLTLIIYTSTTVYFFTTETSTTKHSSFSFRKISNLNLHLNQTSSTAPLIQQPPQKPLTYKHHTAGNNSPKASHILVPTQSPTIEWFAIRRGAGCLRVEKDEIVHYGNCRGNDSSQLWTKLNDNRIVSKLNEDVPMCLAHTADFMSLVLEPCDDKIASNQIWIHDRKSNMKKMKGVTAMPQYLGVRIHTKDFKCLMTPSLKVSSFHFWRKARTTPMLIHDCNTDHSQYNFHDMSKEIFYFVQEKRIQRPVIVILPTTTETNTPNSIERKRKLFITRYRKLEINAPILFVHSNSKAIHKNTVENYVYDFDASNQNIYTQMIEKLSTFSSDQILFANVESSLTSESDLQVLSNTLEKNEHLLGVGGFLIGQGDVLHRNCYTAVNFENQYEREKDSMGREANDVEKDDLGWVAGYNDLTIPTKYDKRCMVCDRIAKPILTRMKDVSILLKMELSLLTIESTDLWKTYSSVWMTSVSSSSSIIQRNFPWMTFLDSSSSLYRSSNNRRFASCPHFVALNDIFTEKSTILRPPGTKSYNIVFPITTTWEENSPCRNKKAKQNKKAIGMWEMLKGTISSLKSEEKYVGVSLEDGTVSVYKKCRIFFIIH